MTKQRNVTPSPARTLTARSVVASTLLGASPPQLPVRTIVRCGALFGFGEGAVRTAVSRMLADGSLEVDSRHAVYRVSGKLSERHARQSESRSPQQRRWNGSWTQVVVTAAARPAAQRASLRTAARTLRLAELREGVWMRPDNLDPQRHEAAWTTVRSQGEIMRCNPDGDPAALAGRLWDLDSWARTARDFESRLRSHRGALNADDPPALAEGFLLSAAVLRHLLADPLLPDELVAGALPAGSSGGWPGARLRQVYDDYDRRYKTAWRQWFSEQV